MLMAATVKYYTGESFSIETEEEILRDILFVSSLRSIERKLYPKKPEN